jgi:hypothetical protein
MHMHMHMAASRRHERYFTRVTGKQIILSGKQVSHPLHRRTARIE